MNIQNTIGWDYWKLFKGDSSVSSLQVAKFDEISKGCFENGDLLEFLSKVATKFDFGYPWGRYNTIHQLSTLGGEGVSETTHVQTETVNKEEKNLSSDEEKLDATLDKTNSNITDTPRIKLDISARFQKINSDALFFTI